MLFFRHVAIFLSSRATTFLFLSKTDVLCYIHYILKNNQFNVF